MGITLDTRKSFLTRQHRDIICSFSWVNEERAMILIPAYRKGAPWFIVMESRAWEYDDPKQLAQSAIKACEVLGIEPSKPNWVRIATIIHEGLPDLVRMPSAPPPEFHDANFGEMHLKANGEIIASNTIQVEKEGVTYE